jgi:hypothetical protein
MPPIPTPSSRLLAVLADQVVKVANGEKGPIPAEARDYLIALAGLVRSADRAAADWSETKIAPPTREQAIAAAQEAEARIAEISKTRRPTLAEADEAMRAYSAAARAIR